MLQYRSHLPVAEFFAAELAARSDVRARYEALGGVMVKSAKVGDTEFRAQCNPSRVVSTSAAVDAASLAARPCFLCRSNRPAAQASLSVGDYELLVNPFPIFSRHFTIPSVSHTPQRIAGRMADMACWAAMMPGYTIFYNGPRCGASAPDHMHFQAGNADALPLPQMSRSAVMATEGPGWTVYADAGAVIPAFGIEAEGAEETGEAFSWLYAAMAGDDSEEPMMNILCGCLGGRIVAVVIPRKAHRPDFYGTGEGQVLISPASADLGGVFVFPRISDFTAADAAMLSEVIRQVCVNPEYIRSIAERL